VTGTSEGTPRGNLNEGEAQRGQKVMGTDLGKGQKVTEGQKPKVEPPPSKPRPPDPPPPKK
jgi:hypothetical protein